jgi:aspartate ammonia-lyase
MACDEILAGKLENEFVTDMIQGGAGTSTNMNANEVIANRANEILGDRKGTYKYVHPNDHVNMSQSTNDSYPTSLHLSIVLSAGQLIQKMTKLCTALREKGEEYDHVLKMGRTQIQDAVPVTVGQEFFSWAHGLEDELEALREVTTHQQTTNLGGTAIGTGVAADRDFARLVTTALSDVTGYQFTKPDDLIEASSNTAGMLRFMDTLKSIAVKASKVCWDMRFMSSGPRGGIFEISLPCVQPHTSLIPGKNDPDICEMVQMCAFRVIGGNLASTMASHAGQLELNYAEPLMIYHCLAGIKMLSAAFDSLTDNCVKGIVANEAHCKKLVSNSVGIVTCLLPFIGYKNCARAAKIATDNNRSISEVLVTEGFLTQEKLDSLMVPENMVKPVRLAPTDKDAEERVAKVRRTT